MTIFTEKYLKNCALGKVFAKIANLLLKDFGACYLIHLLNVLVLQGKRGSYIMKKGLKFKLFTTILFSGGILISHADARGFGEAPLLPSVEINFSALKVLKQEVEVAKQKIEKQKEIVKKIEKVAPEPEVFSSLESADNKNDKPAIGEVTTKTFSKKRVIPQPLDLKHLNIASPVKRPDDVAPEKIKEIAVIANSKEKIVKDNPQKITIVLPDSLPEKGEKNKTENSSIEEKKNDISKDESAISDTAIKIKIAEKPSNSNENVEVTNEDSEESVFAFLDELPSFSDLFEGVEEPLSADIATLNKEVVEKKEAPKKIARIIAPKKSKSPDVVIDKAENLTPREKIASTKVEKIKFFEAKEGLEEKIDPVLTAEIEDNEKRISDPKNYYDLSKVQVILPKEIKKREDFIKPSPEKRPNGAIKIVDRNTESFNENESIPKAQQEQPSIPDPVKIAEVKQVKPNFKVIDDVEWDKILENAKVLADNPKGTIAKITGDSKQIEAVNSSELQNKEKSFFDSLGGWVSSFSTSSNNEDEQSEYSDYQEVTIEPAKTDELSDTKEAKVAINSKEEIKEETVAAIPEIIEEKIDITEQIVAKNASFEIASQAFPAAVESNDDMKTQKTEPKITLKETVDISTSTSAIEADIPDIAPIVSVIQFEQASLPQVEEVDTSVKSLTPAADGTLLSIDYMDSEIKLSDFDQNRLEELSQQISDSDKRIKIISRAVDKEGDVNSARRLSLQRAINIRSFMIKSGLSGMKINVQALGNKDEGNSNRVSIYLSEDK